MFFLNNVLRCGYIHLYSLSFLDVWYNPEVGLLLELIQKNWQQLKPDDGKQKCTKIVWVEIATELKKAGYRSKIEDKLRWCECSQKW